MDSGTFFQLVLAFAKAIAGWPIATLIVAGIFSC
jgi:hypothetical protein